MWGVAGGGDVRKRGRCGWDVVHIRGSLNFEWAIFYCGRASGINAFEPVLVALVAIFTCDVH